MFLLIVLVTLAITYRSSGSTKSKVDFYTAGHGITPFCPISVPSLSNSPWIRGAPHSGLAMLISWISLRMSVGAVGRPPRRLDFQRKYALKPARCQRMIVSGLTIANASQALGNSRQEANKYQPIKNTKGLPSRSGAPQNVDL